jgi:hypothetical protein
MIKPVNSGDRLTAVITFTDRLGMLVGRDGHVVDHDEFAKVVREVEASGLVDLAVTTWSQVVGTMPTSMLVEVVRRCAEAGLPDGERDSGLTQTNSLVDAARRVRRGEGTQPLLAVVDDLRRNQQMGRVLTFHARVAGAVIPSLGGLGTAIRLGRLVPVDPALHPDGVAVVLAAVGSATQGSGARDHTLDILQSTLGLPPQLLADLLVPPLMVMTPPLMGTDGRLAVVNVDAHGVPTGVGGDGVRKLLARLVQAVRVDDEAQLRELRPQVMALDLLEMHFLLWCWVWTLAQHVELATPSDRRGSGG